MALVSQKWNSTALYAGGTQKLIHLKKNAGPVPQYFKGYMIFLVCNILMIYSQFKWFFSVCKQSDLIIQ